MSLVNYFRNSREKYSYSRICNRAVRIRVVYFCNQEWYKARCSEYWSHTVGGSIRTIICGMYFMMRLRVDFQLLGGMWR